MVGGEKMARIGVEQSLSDVQQVLQEKGYDVIPLRSEHDIQGCDCCIVTGQHQNVMGISSTSIKGPVIEASGYTADEICKQVEAYNLS
jgi:hypothetical protein